METQHTNTSGRDDLLVLRGRTPGPEKTCGSEFGTPGFRSCYLYSQVRNHPPGRDRYPQGSSHSEHAARGDVLSRRREYSHRGNVWRRRPYISIIAGLLLLGAAAATGCKRQPAQSLSALYAEAYSQLQYGELDVALKLSDQGF